MGLTFEFTWKGTYGADLPGQRSSEQSGGAPQPTAQGETVQPLRNARTRREMLLPNAFLLLAGRQ